MKPNREEIEHIETMKADIQLKLGWGESEKWTHSDYEKISELIFKDTKVNISSSTLKRFWGKISYDGKISPSTKNALAQYLGHDSWQNYRQYLLNGRKLPNTDGNGAEATYLETPALKSKSVKKLVIAFLAVAVCLFLFFFLREGEKKVSQKITFTYSEQYTQGQFPHTYLMNYDFELPKGDTVFIRFEENEKSQVLDPSNRSITYFYRRPGKHKVRVWSASGQELAKSTVYVTSSGWYKANAPNGMKEKYYFFIACDSNSSKGFAQYTYEEVNTQTTLDNYWTSILNYTPFELLDGDNFVLKTKVKNNSEIGGIKQYDIILRIVGEYDRHNIHLISSGGFKWIRYEVSESKISGDTADLSHLEVSFDDWREIEIENIAQTLKVSIDGKEISSTSYKQPIGKIQGFQYFFKGSGMVKDIHVFHPTGEPLYSFNF